MFFTSPRNTRWLSFLTVIVLNNWCSGERIGGFRDSQSDVIFAHAHIRGNQRYYTANSMESVLNVGLYFEKNGLL